MTRYIYTVTVEVEDDSSGRAYASVTSEAGEHGGTKVTIQTDSINEGANEIGRIILDDIELDMYGFKCKGCGREESVCSANPCPDVIADRKATV